MRYNWNTLVAGMEKRPPASDGAIAEFVKALDFDLPTSYIEIIQEMNGGEGPVGGGYFQLWPIEDVVENNKKYNIPEFLPGYFIFGTNLGGTAYAFEKNTGLYVRFEFVDMDDPQPLGGDMLEFLQSFAT
jgi:SMI1 / KNR4 family (SUKH-1)